MKMNQTIKNMLNGEYLTSVPPEVLEFLESQFDLKNYEKVKTGYLSLMTVKQDKLLLHLKTSYHIAEFWKNMYLTEITHANCKPMIKMEPCSSPSYDDNSEESPMPTTSEQGELGSSDVDFCERFPKNNSAKQNLLINIFFLFFGDVL